METNNKDFITKRKKYLNELINARIIYLSNTLIDIQTRKNNYLDACIYNNKRKYNQKRELIEISIDDYVNVYSQYLTKYKNLLLNVADMEIDEVEYHIAYFELKNLRNESTKNRDYNQKKYERLFDEIFNKYCRYRRKLKNKSINNNTGEEGDNNGN